MRRCWQILIIRVAPAVLAVPAFAQPMPTPTPSPTPPPIASSALTVRIVPPSPDGAPDPTQSVPVNPVDAVPAEATAGEKKAAKNELVIAPIPLSNPTIGSGLGVAAVYTLAKKEIEKETPPTTLGAGGFYTDSGSWAGAVAAKASLKEDRFRLTLAGALGRINYDLFALGPREAGIPITQDVKGALGEFMVGLGKHWFAGLRAAYGKTKVGLQASENDTIPVPTEQLDVTLVALGLKGERDSRDNVFYPTTGSRLQFLVNYNDTAFGSDYTYEKTDISYSKYIKISEPWVLAFKGSGCYASSGAPFFDLCLFGASNVLRGYTVGRYLDRWTVAVQAETRWRFANRWVTTAFLGVGDVQPALPSSADNEALPSGGLGVQWIAAPQNMITVRVDYAWGQDGSHGLYVSIGQAF
ncbi:MAG TPA: BamA/TamA family outer membrane protein [Thermoanaerobaculaceae bacterium]|nr:BamA/TamA family outer membrane protein [Thermoanaerobaculaceae bacterium]